jgi:hypothetical protein
MLICLSGLVLEDFWSLSLGGFERVERGPGRRRLESLRAFLYVLSVRIDILS